MNQIDDEFRGKTLQKRSKLRQIQFRNMKKSIVNVFTAEPFLTPLHHLNLVFSELGVPSASADEVSRAVNVIREQFSGLSFSIKDKLSQKRSRKKAESILTVSQVSMSQYEEQTEVLHRNAPLVDVIQILCESRDLTIERLNVKHKDEFNRLEVIHRQAVLLYIDKKEPFFVSIFDVPENLNYKNPLTTFKGRGYIQVICCNPAQWRCLHPQKKIALSTKNFVVISISRTNPPSLLDNYLPRDQTKRLKKGSRSPERKKTRLTSEPSSPRIDFVSDRESTDEGNKGINTSVFEEEFLLPKSPKSGSSIYSKTPYPRESLFSRRDALQDDPLLRMPRGSNTLETSQNWFYTVFTRCSGTPAKKRLLERETHAITAVNDDDDGRYFVEQLRQ